MPTDTALYAGPGAPLERPVPYDLGAEEAVLGSLLLDRDAIIKIAGSLRPADFYREANGWIYETILDLYARREPPDLVILSSALDQRGLLEPVGGLPYLAKLLRQVPTAVHVGYYAAIVARSAGLRRLITVGGQIAGLGYEEGLDLATVYDRAEALLFAATQAGRTDVIRSLKMVLDAVFDDYTARDGVIADGLLTGFDRFDRMTTGLKPGDLVIVAARPGVGKSSLGLSIAYNAARDHGKRIGIFSLEMGAEQLAQRLITIESGVPTQAVRTGRLGETHWQRISDAFGALADLPIYFDDSPRLSLSDLNSRARRLHAEVGCDLLVIDYLQMMHGGQRRDGNRVQEVSEITRGLKELARELGVPIIAMSQLSRAVEARNPKIPQLSDLRESGSIEMDADIVIFIYREELYLPMSPRAGWADIIFAKHRNGPTGVIPLRFDGPTTHFYDPDPLERVPEVLTTPDT